MNTESIIGSQFPKKVIPLIDSSRKSIDIIVFDWRWYPQDPGASVQLFNQSIVRAVRRGVAVRAIANNDEIIKVLNGCGVSARRLRMKNLVHVKLMIIDGECAILGSHNYTQSAFTMNLEISTILRSSESVLDYVDFFRNLWDS